MNLRTALNGTIGGDFLFACLFFAGLKLLAALVQIRLMRADWHQMPDTTLFRLVYVTGKAAPAIACLCGLVSALLLHDRFYVWFFGGFGSFIALLAVYVVRLRSQGRFFGAIDFLSSAKRR